MIYPRAIYTDIEKHLDTTEAVILTGMRRTGKTTLLTLIRDHLKTGNKLFLDLENPLNRKYFEEDDYEKIKATLEFLGLSFRKKSYILRASCKSLKKGTSVILSLSKNYGKSNS
jgi:predicted AAA+ superfamily ATPase